MRSMIFVGIVLLFAGSKLYAQLSLETIDLDRIKQKKIRSHLSIDNGNDIHWLSDFKPSCKDCSEIDGYRVMQNSYLRKQSPEKVWNAYSNTSVSESWNGRLVSFGILFSKWTDFVCYRNEDRVAQVDTGQVFFINLKILKGIYNLPVGVEIVDVNENKRTLQFSYIDGGKSEGAQIIQLIPTEKGYTEVVHFSSFKSDSEFRDKFLYPYYHTRVLNEFHRNMARRVINHRKEFIVN